MAFDPNDELAPRRAAKLPPAELLDPERNTGKDDLLVAIAAKESHVIIGFSKPIEWMAFDAQEAENFAAKVLQKAHAVRTGRE